MWGIEAEGRRDLGNVSHPRDHFQTDAFAVEHQLISDAAKKPERSSPVTMRANVFKVVLR